jgi:hypothetical protein
VELIGYGEFVRVPAIVSLVPAVVDSQAHQDKEKQMSKNAQKETETQYERKGARPAKGDDGKPVRIAVSNPSKSGATVKVKAVNFTNCYQGIDKFGREMRKATLDRDWQPVKK